MEQQVRQAKKNCSGGAESGGDCHFDCASAYDGEAEIGVWLEAILRDDIGGWYSGTCIRPTSLRTGFPLERTGDADALMASGKCGKVAVCADEELK